MLCYQLTVGHTCTRSGDQKKCLVTNLKATEARPVILIPYLVMVWGDKDSVAREVRLRKWYDLHTFIGSHDGNWEPVQEVSPNRSAQNICLLHQLFGGLS